jgi:carbonic anhydrase/acetyltransferase-like protein (isoleucine patch superfamily)
LAVSERKYKDVELGAVVVVPAREDLTGGHETQSCAATAGETSSPLYSSRLPILGNDVLHSWMERIRKLGVPSLWLTSGPRDGRVDLSALANFVRQGVERLLVIKLKSYAEMDLADLLRFHCERNNPVTEAHDARGRLGVSLLDQLALRARGERQEVSAAPICGRVPYQYQFNGYAKCILSAKERQELVGDALTGACAMRPAGTQIREQLWVGEGVNLAESARLVGPAYIGAHTTIRAGATIGSFASVEHDCVVDCGTTVEGSTVLPHTYLAPGILIRQGLVDGGYLQDLGSGAVADLQPAGLASRIQLSESHKRPVEKTMSDASPRADSSFAWDFVPSSTAAQTWLRVQL